MAGLTGDANSIASGPQKTQDKKGGRAFSSKPNKMRGKGGEFSFEPGGRAMSFLRVAKLGKMTLSGKKQSVLPGI